MRARHSCRPAHRVYALVRIWWKAGWSARGQYDEQRIAALVAALEEIRDELWHDAVHPQPPINIEHVKRSYDGALRALAGQTEE